MGYLPELHMSFNQCQRQEVLFALLVIVQQYSCHFRSPELHGNSHSVVGLHGLESQVRLATKGWYEVLYN